MRRIDAEKLPHYDGTALSEAAVARAVEDAPTVDAVPKADYDNLLKRFKHLIQSDYIKSFDAWDSRKNDYVLDIRDAVEVVRCKDCKWYEIEQLKRDGADDKRYKPSVCVIGKYAKPRKEDWYCADGERREDA